MQTKLLLAAAALLVAAAPAAAQVAKVFKDEGIVDTVLSKAPRAELKVEYVEEEVEAELGNTLTVAKAQSKPRVTYTGANPGKVNLMHISSISLTNRHRGGDISMAGMAIAIPASFNMSNLKRPYH